jgi:hypothetical protein
MNWFKKTFGKLTNVESRIEYDIRFLNGLEEGHFYNQGRLVLEAFHFYIILLAEDGGSSREL